MLPKLKHKTLILVERILDKRRGNKLKIFYNVEDLGFIYCPPIVTTCDYCAFATITICSGLDSSLHLL